MTLAIKVSQPCFHIYCFLEELMITLASNNCYKMFHNWVIHSVVAFNFFICIYSVSEEEFVNKPKIILKNGKLKYDKAILEFI